MNNHRCLSDEKSLNTVRKWLLEGGDGLSKSIYIPKQKSYLNKIIKRKKSIYKKPSSIIDWFYEFIKNIFTPYDESPLHSDDTIQSIRTCSTCRFKRNQSTLKLNKNKSKIMVTTATSSSNFNTSKSTQTQANNCIEQSKTYPLYCFSIKDGQILPLQFSSASSSFYINKKKSQCCGKTDHSIVPLIPTDIHSYSSYQPSIQISNSNTVSLQTTQPFKDNHLIPKLHPSLHDTRTCHFDKRNCLIECCHSSNTNINAPEMVFAENTCQLIKQAWLSSTSDQQMNFEA